MCLQCVRWSSAPLCHHLGCPIWKFSFFSFFLFFFQRTSLVPSFKGKGFLFQSRRISHLTLSLRTPPAPRKRSSGWSEKNELESLLKKTWTFWRQLCKPSSHSHSLPKNHLETLLFCSPATSHLFLFVFCGFLESPGPFTQEFPLFNFFQANVQPPKRKTTTQPLPLSPPALWPNSECVKIGSCIPPLVSFFNLCIFALISKWGNKNKWRQLSPHSPLHPNHLHPPPHSSPTYPDTTP